MGAIGSLPGAILEPGLLWNGMAGYSSCDMDVFHWTAGWNSIGICRDRGLVQHLTRDEGVYQFVADVGMVAWTQCEFNRVATANEVESIDGSVSEAQLALMAYREQWLIAQTGIPPIYFDAPSMGAPRMPVGTPYRGVTNHRSLVHHACDMHSDGFDVWVWERVWGGTPPPPEEPEDEMRGFFAVSDDGTVPGYWYVHGATKVWAKSKEVVDHLAIRSQSQNNWDNPERLPAAVLLRLPTIGDEPPGMPTP